METLTLDLPTMFGDHHVVEVRRLLMELPGVASVYASSSFHIVEVQFDQSKVTAEKIEKQLEEAGYLGELAIPVEKGAVGERQNGDKPFFRHTTAYEQAGRSVSFAQNIPFAGRPLWPCPGMGPIEKSVEELTNG